MPLSLSVAQYLLYINPNLIYYFYLCFIKSFKSKHLVHQCNCCWIIMKDNVFNNLEIVESVVDSAVEEFFEHEF